MNEPPDQTAEFSAENLLSPTGMTVAKYSWKSSGYSFSAVSVSRKMTPSVRASRTARALASRPEIVFADEPTGALDSRSGNELLGFLRTAVDDLGFTVDAGRVTGFLGPNGSGKPTTHKLI